MKYYIICDYRENFSSYVNSSQEVYNDHPDKKNIHEIITAINDMGYDCEYFGGIPELVHAVDNNIVFENCIFLNFTDGMDQAYSRAQAPALLEMLNVPYSGSDVFATVLMNNKHFCKKALSDKGIIMPKSHIVNKCLPLTLIHNEICHYPVFVKPNCEGSSLGISKDSICYTYEDVVKQSNSLLNLFDEIIIEDYVTGIDVTNYLIGNNDNYPVNEVIAAKLFDQSQWAVYGIDEKTNKKRYLYLNEEFLDSKIVSSIRSMSITIARTIGVKDICRIDYRFNSDTDKISFIEINSAPRFSSTSEIGFIAEKQNTTFKQMVKYYLDCVNARLKNNPTYTGD